MCQVLLVDGINLWLLKMDVDIYDLLFQQSGIY